MRWCRSSLTSTVTCARLLQNRATQNDGSWTDGHTAGGARPGLTAVVQTLLSCPSRFQVTSTGGHSQVAAHKVSHVHVVRVRRAGRLGLFLGLPPSLPPYKLVVVLQLLLPLLLVVHLLRASSLGEKKIEMSTALRLYSTTSETSEGDFGDVTKQCSQLTSKRSHLFRTTFLWSFKWKKKSPLVLVQTLIKSPSLKSFRHSATTSTAEGKQPSKQHDCVTRRLMRSSLKDFVSSSVNHWSPASSAFFRVKIFTSILPWMEKRSINIWNNQVKHRNMRTHNRQKSSADEENNWSQHENGTMKTESEEGCCSLPSEEGASGAVIVFKNFSLLAGKKAETLIWKGKTVNTMGS